jgi:hypothetical protein
MGLLEAGMKIIPSGASPVLYILIKTGAVGLVMS